MIHDLKFMEEMKNYLLKEKEDIIKALISDNEDFYNLSNSRGDIVDEASSNTDISLLNALSLQEQKKLGLIDAALERIKNNNYGICQKTGKLIPEERLRSIPYALYTIEAQEEIEKRRRR